MTGADKNVPSVVPVSGSTLHACVVTGGQDDRSASGWIVAGHVTACVANDAQSALAAARRIPAARVPVVPVDGRAHPHEAHYAWPLRADAFAACTALAWIDGDILTLVSPVNDRADRATLAAQVGFPVDRITWQTSEVTNDPALALRAAIAAVTLAQACGRPVQVDGIIDHDTHAHFTLSASFDRTGALQEWDTMASATHAVADAESAPVIYTAAHAVSRSADPSHAIPPQAHVFARESFIDEIAGDTTRDPVALRLTHLADHSARELIRSVAQRAAWHGGTRDRKTSAKRSGRGFAFDRSADPAPAYTAWIVDLEVDRRTGEVSVNRVVAGRGSGSLVKGVPARQIADAVARTLGLRIRAEPSHDETPGDQPLSHAVTAAATSAAMPQLDAAALLDASTPAAAAIANALFDATGVRFRAPPFTPERVREALAQAAAPRHKRTPAAWFSASRLRGGIGGGLGGALGGALIAAGIAAASLLPFKLPIAPIPKPSASTWSAATIERGRLLAAVGDCAVCHTAIGGATNAGGLGLDTPFGTVYSTNLTPDEATGIGAWSFTAFDRAMRQGISRDGRHLYPAFPYTAFTKMSDADMTALYAYLMSQPAVVSSPPQTRLRFPLNQRPVMAGWNALYLKQGEYAPDPTRTAQWNRGAYLVDGLGHCSACHSPRNALGAEAGGRQYLTGGAVDGWVAPSLVASSKSPVKWTEAALFDYLKSGFSSEHGVAAGPMAPVVAGLSTLPESDVRAIAHYVASFSAQTQTQTQTQPAVQTQRESASPVTLRGLENGQRLFDGACAVCHAATGGVGNFGVRPLMSLNTSVSEATPDNLLHVIQNGIDAPATDELGYMPGFKDSFDDRQIADLARFIRARYAPGEAAWTGLEQASARIRASTHETAR